MAAAIPYHEQEEALQQPQARRVPWRASPRHEVTVVATGLEATETALRAACDIVRPVMGRVRLLVPVVVGFPAQLNAPPTSLWHLSGVFLAMAAADAHMVDLSLWPCRDPRPGLATSLSRHATVVVGTKGFLDLRARRMSRWLAGQGHRVLLACPEPRRSRSRRAG
jgi:hypothetical protein